MTTDKQKIYHKILIEQPDTLRTNNFKQGRNMMIQKAQEGTPLKYFYDRMQEEHDNVYNDYGMRAPGTNRQANIARQYFNQAPTIQNLSRGVYHWVQSDPLNLYGAWQGIKQDMRRLNRDSERKEARIKRELYNGQPLEALKTFFLRKKGGRLTINKTRIQ